MKSLSLYLRPGWLSSLMVRPTDDAAGYQPVGEPGAGPRCNRHRAEHTAWDSRGYLQGRAPGAFEAAREGQLSLSGDRLPASLERLAFGREVFPPRQWASSARSGE